MLEPHVRQLRDFLGIAMEAAGVARAADVDYDRARRFFSVAGTGIEVALEKATWRVREVYDVADLANGGTRIVEETIVTVSIGEETGAATAAAMRAVQRRIEAAIDGMA